MKAPCHVLRAGRWALCAQEAPAGAGTGFQMLGRLAREAASPESRDLISVFTSGPIHLKRKSSPNHLIKGVKGLVHNNSTSGSNTLQICVYKHFIRKASL